MKYKKYLIFIVFLMVLGINKTYAANEIGDTATCFYQSNDLRAFVMFKYATKSCMGGGQCIGMNATVKIDKINGETGKTATLSGARAGNYDTLDLKLIKNNYGFCPSTIGIKQQFSGNYVAFMGNDIPNDAITATNTSVESYLGVKNCGGEECKIGENVELKCDGSESIFGDPNYAGTPGNDDDPPSTAYILKQILNVMRIVAIAAVMVLGTLDIARAALASKEDEMKKAQTKFIKRVIASVAIFLVPTFVSIIMNLSYDIWQKNNYTTCKFEQVIR